MSHWKFSRLLSFAMSAALAFTSVVPAHAAEELLFDEEPEVASFAESSEEVEADLLEEPDEIAQLMTVATGTTITFVASDGTNAISSDVGGEKVESKGITTTSEDKITVTEPNDIVVTGYTRSTEKKGWYLEATGKNSVDLSDLGSATLTEDKLYAIYDINEYTVTYKANGGTGDDQTETVEYLGNPTGPDTAFTRSGYTLAGWAKTEAGTAADLNTFSITENTTLYAIWAEPTTYKVTFNSNDGSAVSEQTGKKTGDKVTKPSNPTRENYTFDAWYKDSELKTVWDFDTDTIAYANVTLYAGWIANYSLTVPENYHYSTIEYAAEVAAGSTPSFSSVSSKGTVKTGIPTTKALYVRLAAENGYKIVAPSDSDFTISDAITSGSDYNIYGKKGTTLYKITKTNQKAFKALELTAATAITNEITVVVSTDNKAEATKANAVGGTANPMVITGDVTSWKSGSGATGSKFDLAYGKSVTISFLPQEGYTYTVAKAVTGTGEIVQLGSITASGSYETFTVGLTGVEASETITIFEKSKDITGNITLAGKVTTANDADNITFWTSADGKDYEAYTAATSVKYGDTLYVKFQGTNGYVYTAKATEAGTAHVDGTVVDAKGRMEVAAEKDEDGRTIYVGYFTVTNVYEASTITLTAVAKDASTVTLDAVSGDGAAKSISYSKDNGANYVAGTSFTAAVGDTTIVKFVGADDYNYTVTVDGNDALVNGKNTALIEKTGGEYKFTVTGVSADTTITITPALKGYTFVIVDDEDAGFTPLLTFKVTSLKDDKDKNITLAAAATKAINDQGITFAPRKTGYYFDSKYYNKDTEVAADAANHDWTIDALAPTGATTTLVVHYSPDVYTIEYFDSEQKDSDGNIDFANAGTAVATQSETYGNKKPSNKAGAIDAVRTAYAAHEASTGYKFAKAWRIYEAEYYDAKGNKIADLTDVKSPKVKYVSRGVVDDLAVFSSDLSTTHGGSVYVVPVYEDASYTVNFAVGNAWSDFAKGSNSSMTIKASEMDKALPESMFSAVGYDFAGWALSATDSGADVSTYGDVFLTKSFASSVTLYATFALHPYTITYHDLQSATPDTETYTYGTSHDLTDPAAMSGFAFDGWYYDAEYKKAVSYNTSTGKYYIPATSTGDINVYAKYVASDITIIYDPNYSDATAKKVEQKVKNNIKATLTKNSFTRDNYEFAGWALNTDGAVTYLDQADVAFTSAQATDGKVSLFAVWAASGTEYTVTLDLNGGKATATDGAITGWTKADSTYSAKYTYGTATTYPTLPTADDIKLDNYELAGWTLVGSGEAVTSISGMKGNFTLKAKWAGKTFKVTYDSNSSKLSKNTKVSGKMNAVNVKYGDTWAPLDSAFTANGYTFQGWAKTADSTTAISMAPSAWEYTEDQTLYAIWKAESEVLYLYSAYGKIDETSYKLGTHTVASSGLDVFSYAFDDVTTKKVALPTKDQMDPDANGLTFKGWYKSAVDAYGNPTYKPGSKKASQVAIGDDTVYVAKWVGNYTVTFHNGTDEVSQKIKLDKSTSLKANKFKESGYIFTGWDIDGDGVVDFKNKAKVTNTILNTALGGEPELLDYDLYAVFVPTEKTYNLTVLDESGSVLETTTFNYKKGLATKKVTALGKSLSSNFNYFVDSVTGKKVSKIKAKTAGDQTFILVEKAKVVKTTLVFDKNAPSGVKVTGSVSKKTVKSTAEIVKNVGKFKAKGLTVDYFTDKATNLRYYVTPNGSMYLNAGITHDGAHITDTYVGGKVTLTAHWTNEEPTVYYYYYNLGAADANLNIDYAYSTLTAQANVNGCKVFRDVWLLFDDAYVLPTPTRAGYKFAGWTEQNASGSYVKTTAAITSATTRNLVATWTPIE